MNELVGQTQGVITNAVMSVYSEVSEKIGQLKMTAPDGKQRFTDCAEVKTGTDIFYWRKLKQRLKAEGSEVVTFCHGLTLPTKAAFGVTPTEGQDRMPKKNPTGRDVGMTRKASMNNWVRQT